MAPISKSLSVIVSEFNDVPTRVSERGYSAAGGLAIAAGGVVGLLGSVELTHAVAYWASGIIPFAHSTIGSLAVWGGSIYASLYPWNRNGASIATLGQAAGATIGEYFALRGKQARLPNPDRE